MKHVDKLQAHFDFPSATTFRITTPYRQKTFNVSDQEFYVNLESLKKIQSPTPLGLPDSDFFARAYKSIGKYRYEIYAKTSDDSEPEVIETIKHLKETTVKVNIYRG